MMSNPVPGNPDRKNSVRARIRHVLALLAAVFLMANLLQSQGALAQTATGKSPTAIIQLFQAIVNFPPPEWQDPDNLLQGSEIARRQSGNTFVLEFIPKGQTFESWRQLYAVYALKSSGMELSDFVERSIVPFNQGCGEENLKTRTVSESEASVLVQIFCENSAGAPKEMGYGDGVGEIAVMWFGRYRQTFVKVYQQWRGPRFSEADPETWPAKQEEIDRVFRRMALVKLAPS